jgi:hypothetical protein
MHNAQRIVFMGTSLSVNITTITLRTALTNYADIEVVDPQPIDRNTFRKEGIYYFNRRVPKDVKNAYRRC